MKAESATLRSRQESGFQEFCPRSPGRRETGRPTLGVPCKGRGPALILGRSALPSGKECPPRGANVVLLRRRDCPPLGWAPT
ncbi:hypothetical protein Nepgr_016206 [Nepenthes gracilis]|uniref:Uncharacterized protein n=1 Tax=Nepenthes gracilis TaxID=150966 RepID=A0AAD3SP94_NEPGR|nr:hypothetical protein Nepgr_016206 [Nepenthes gracilis]